jgi:hypothetical protein
MDEEEKMNTDTKATLSIPRGLDCFNCEIYEKNINKGEGVTNG